MTVSRAIHVAANDITRRLTDMEPKLTVTKEGERGLNLEFEMNRYTLLHRKQTYSFQWTYCIAQGIAVNTLFLEKVNREFLLWLSGNEPN